MDQFKSQLVKVFTNIDFHLNMQDKILTIIYGENCIALRLGDDKKIHLDTNLVLDGPSPRRIESNIQ